MPGPTLRSRLVASLAAGLAVSIVSVTAGPADAYDGAAAATYADTYATSPNSSQYPVFTTDCTNFVSQAVHAGGFPFRNANKDSTSVTNWWINSGQSHAQFSWSQTWSVAVSYHNFLVADYPGGNPKGTAPGTSTDYWTPPAMVDGDVLFYDWGQGDGISHSAIQVGYGTDPNLSNQVWAGNYIDEHTNNRYHAFWSLKPYNAFYATTATTTIYFLHIDAAN
jgi:hypothetical protein